MEAVEHSGISHLPSLHTEVLDPLLILHNDFQILHSMEADNFGCRVFPLDSMNIIQHLT